MAAEAALGSVEIAYSEPNSKLVRAAVISVPKYLQANSGSFGLTDFVIVQMFEATGHRGIRVLKDGSRQPLGGRSRGELSWQLDTGSFRDDPVLGPIWYQARGWSCQPSEDGFMGQLCGFQRPPPADPASSSMLRTALAVSLMLSSSLQTLLRILTPL